MVGMQRLRPTSIGGRGISTVETTRGFAANQLILKHGILTNTDCSVKSVPCTSFLLFLSQIMGVELFIDPQASLRPSNQI
jgi:hypothetical protein